MFVKVRCPNCGRLYWKGSRHRCPASPPTKPPNKQGGGGWLDPDINESDYWFFRFLDAMFWGGVRGGCFGCILPPILLLVLLAAVGAAYLR
jgi:hypothetical protein